jgi:hypothetical protein
MRDPMDRLCSLLNLANPPLSKPPPPICQLGPIPKEREE